MILALVVQGRNIRSVVGENRGIMTLSRWDTVTIKRFPTLMSGTIAA